MVERKFALKKKQKLIRKLFQQKQMYFNESPTVTNEKLNESRPIAAWSYDVEGFADTSVERYCGFAGTSASARRLAGTPCLDDNQLFLLWTVNMRGRSVTKWNTAGGKILSRLIRDIQQTKHYGQYCFVGDNSGLQTCLMEKPDIHHTRTPHWCHTPRQTNHRNSTAKGWRSVMMSHCTA